MTNGIIDKTLAACTLCTKYRNVTRRRRTSSRTHSVHKCCHHNTKPAADVWVCAAEEQLSHRSPTWKWNVKSQSFVAPCLCALHLCSILVSVNWAELPGDSGARVQEVDNSGVELHECACPCKVRGRWCACACGPHERKRGGLGRISCRRIACSVSLFPSRSLPLSLSLSRPTLAPCRLAFIAKAFPYKEASKTLHYKL